MAEPYALAASFFRIFMKDMFVGIFFPEDGIFVDWVVITVERGDAFGIHPLDETFLVAAEQFLIDFENIQALRLSVWHSISSRNLPR